MKSNTYLAILSAVALSVISSAQANEKRWFEMEVILFSQLGDKSQLKENFNDTPPMPKYRRVRDLLSEFLTPDIRMIKKHLPICETQQQQTKQALSFDNFPLTTVFKQLTLPTIFPTKTANDLQAEMLLEHPELTSAYYQVPEQQAAQAAATTEINNSTLTELTNEKNSLANNPDITALTFEQQAILAAAEQAFAEPSYQFSPLAPSQKLCRLSSNDIQALTAADPEFDANSFEIEQVPKTINAVETPLSSEPYLISSDSLELHDIVKQLSLSRDFKPLLHIGWRQSEPAINKRRSIPMRLFAGENLAAHYKKQLAQYETELAQAQAQEHQLQTLLMNLSADNTSHILSNEDSDTLAKQLYKQNKLNEIIANLKQMPTDKTALLAELDAIKASSQVKKSQDLVLKAPLKPAQDWTIDGLFNVHLNHYLYITVDLNIANMSLAEQASKSLAKGEPVPIKSIRFSQNKRVISKEIHYFDHPYIGMIVQIRRHHRPDLTSLNKATDN